MISKEFWADLVLEGYIKDPGSFIRSTSHYSFVNQEKDVNFLRTRFSALKDHPLFKEMEYSEDFEVIKSWLPLVMEGRNESEKVACTKMVLGTDVDFGSLTKQILHSLVKRNEVELHCRHSVKNFRRVDGNRWSMKVENLQTQEESFVQADFVFIGAGGGSITLLEKTGLPESHGFGGFPVGGEWLVCENPDIVKRHQAKVYGQAKIGAPPMSVPHLDTRIIDGKTKLLFGPFAVFSTKFLKNGSHWDFFKSLQMINIGFISQAGWKNMDLTRYLLQQVSLSKKDKIKELKNYLPSAQMDDWKEHVAGQRIQLIKKDKVRGGILEFGTEVVSSSDGSLAAMLGASPGASTSVSIIIEVLRRCFKEQFESPEWKEKFKVAIPSLDLDLSQESVADESKARTANILKLN